MAMTKDSGVMPGRLFVVSGPSGVGKTVLCARMLEEFKGRLVLSISATCRSPRQGEMDGRDYFFKSRSEMERLIREDQLAEWAMVHDHYYGTPKAFLEENRQRGMHVILNIDVQGAHKLRQVYPDAVTFFIAPPSLDVLEQRLRKRKADEEAVLRKRMQNALVEMSCEKEYQYVVINDDLERAVAELAGLIRASLPGSPA